MSGFLWLLSLQLVAVASLKHNRASHPPRIDHPPPEPPHHKCKVGWTQVTGYRDCSLSLLARNEITLVYPEPTSSHARCIYSTSMEYAFQVVPRSPDKLLVHFEGGGACWNRFTTLALGACWRDQIWAFPLNHTIFDGTSPDNPYKDFTLVWVNACSGDLHSGNVVRDYRDDNFLPVEQRGFYNTRSVLDWIKGNLGGKPLTSLALMGESAGGIGVQVWAQTLLQELRYEKASVLVDSYAAVFPKGFQGPVFKSLGVCETGIFKQPHLLRLCNAANITVSDVFEQAIEAFPNVTFAMINSKYDMGQIAFDGIASTAIGVLPHTPEEYHRELLSIMRRYNKYPNFVSYLVSSSNHVFSNGYLGFKRIRDTSVIQMEYAPQLIFLWGDRKQALMENYLHTTNGLLDWVAKLPLAPGESIESHCDLLDARHIAAVNGYPVTSDYCDPMLSHKVFRAPLRE